MRGQCRCRLSPSIRQHGRGHRPLRWDSQGETAPIRPSVDGVVCGSRPPGRLHRVPARTPGKRPGLHLPGAAGHLAVSPVAPVRGPRSSYLPRPASRAGPAEMAARRYIMTAGQPGRRSKAGKTRDGRGDGMLPPGHSGENRRPSGRFPPRRGRPANPGPRSSLGAGCCPAPSRTCDCPQRGVSVVSLGLATAWPTREAPDRPGEGRPDRPGCSLPPRSRQAEGVPL